MGTLCKPVTIRSFTGIAAASLCWLSATIGCSQTSSNQPTPPKDAAAKTVEAVQSSGQAVPQERELQQPKSSSRLTSSLLLTQWSGEVDALPSEEQLERGWASLRRLAEAGNSEAQFRYGLLMLFTKPTSTRQFEPKEAIRWIRKAADGGHILAASELAGCHLEGILVKQDVRKAESLFERGAKLGDPKCLWGSGFLKYQRGARNTGKAQMLQAAEAGYPSAQVQIGEFYLYGTEFPVDAAKAKQWYLKAAKQGHVIAQYNLGTMAYLAGNFKDAKAWLKRAAKQNHADAAQNLAALYFDEGDLSRAEYFVDLAIRLGNVEAVRMRTGIKRQQMLEGQIQEGIFSSGFSGY